MQSSEQNTNNTVPNGTDQKRVEDFFLHFQIKLGKKKHASERGKRESVKNICSIAKKE